MSPFACSLFTLVALLATAHGYCTTKLVGRKAATVYNYDPDEFGPDGIETILGENCPNSLHVVGEVLTACNKDPKGRAPIIDGPEDGTWSPFSVWCKFECPKGGIIKVKQYCG